MKIRLIIGTILVALLFGMAWLDHLAGEGYVYIVFACLVTFFALREFYSMAERAGARVPQRMAVFAGMSLVLVQWVMGLGAAKDHWIVTSFVFTRPGAVVGILTVACLACFLSRVYKGQIEGALLSVGATMLGLIYIPVMVTFLTAMRREWGTWGLVSFLMVCKMSDSAAYLVGSSIGKKRLAPRVSPKKTFEGAFAGVAAAVLCAVLCATTGLIALSPVIAAIFGLVVGCVSVVGDLSESVLKRDSKIRDSSAFLPGFGGVLDLVDDVLYTAPIAYYFFNVTLNKGVVL